MTQLETTTCLHAGWVSPRLEGRFMGTVWDKRYGKVLQTSDPQIVEMVLFEDDHATTICGRLQIELAESNFRVRAGMSRKSHRFQVLAHLPGESRDAKRHRFEFAVRSRKELHAWRDALTDDCMPGLGRNKRPTRGPQDSVGGTAVETASFDTLLSCHGGNRDSTSSSSVDADLRRSSSDMCWSTSDDDAMCATPETKCCQVNGDFKRMQCVLRGDLGTACSSKVMCLGCMQRLLQATQRCPCCCREMRDAAPTDNSRAFA